MVARVHRNGFTIGIGEPVLAFSDEAVFVFAVAHFPLADVGLPNARVEFIALIGVMRPHFLARIARDDFGRIGQKSFGFGVDLGV